MYSPSRPPLPPRENSIETCILFMVKQITSPGWMHETSARACALNAILIITFNSDLPILLFQRDSASQIKIPTHLALG